MAPIDLAHVWCVAVVCSLVMIKGLWTHVHLAAVCNWAPVYLSSVVYNMMIGFGRYECASYVLILIRLIETWLVIDIIGSLCGLLAGFVLYWARKYIDILVVFYLHRSSGNYKSIFC